MSSQRSLIICRQLVAGVPLSLLLAAITLLVTEQASAALVTHWNLEEGAGTTTSAVVGAPDANGTLVGSAGWDTQFLPPVVGGTSAAVTFSGSPDAITTSLIGIEGSSPRTVAAWLRADPNQPDLTAIASWGDNVTGNRFSFRLDAAGDTAGSLRLEIAGDFAIGNAKVNDGQWHHVAVVLPDNDPDGDGVVDLDDISFYIDGVLDADMNTGFGAAGAADEPVNTIVSEGLEVVLGNSPHNLGAYGISGALDDVRIYDHALTSGEVAALAPTSAGSFGITVNRQSGNITLDNTTSNNINFVAYSITSDAGALIPSAWNSIADTGDMNSGGSIDSSDNWLEFTPPGDNDDLSEGEQPGGDGVTISNGSTLDFGNVWLQSAIEDVQMVLLTDTGAKVNVPVAYVGTEIPIGDMDFDGDIDGDDWPIYRAGLLADLSGFSGAQQYQMGDLDGNGTNDELDFALFKNIFEANMGIGSFEAMLASVPEPSSCMLLALAGSAFILQRRRTTMTKQQAGHLCQFTAAMIIVAIACIDEAKAVVVWTGASNSTEVFNDANYDFSGSTLTAIDESNNATANYIMDDVTFSSATIAASDFTDFGQYGMADGFTLTLDNTSFTTNGTGGIASADGGTTATVELLNNSSANLQFISRGIVMNVDGTSSLTFRGAGDPINSQGVDNTVFVNLSPGAQLTLPSVAEFTEQGDDIYVNGVNFTSDPSILSFVGNTATAVGSAPPLTLEVNSDTGVIKLINGTGAPIDLDFYKVTSASNSLDTTNWVSLADRDQAAFPAGDGSGNGWEEGGGSNSGALGEAFLQGFSTLADGAELNLGSAFDQGAGQQDLMLRYRDTGLGAFIDVEATYVTGVVDGDFDDDGDTDGGDFLNWQRGFPTAPHNAAGLASWESNFGNGVGAESAVTAVPEPASFVLMLGGLVGWLCCIVHRRKMAYAVVQNSNRKIVVGFAAWAVVGSAAFAASTLDRNYQFGDDSVENASAGDTVGSGSGAGGATFDSEGTPGNFTFVDLLTEDDPKYVNVDALGRPMASSGELGIEFDGDGDYLIGVRLGLPSSSESSTAGEGPLNYEGISNRGFQFWVRPNSAGNGAAQSLVADTEQHGAEISSNGTWVMQYAGADVESGVSVPFDAWSHVMVVRPFGGAGINSGARMYVNGIAVAAAAGGYTGADDTPLVVGSNSGDTPGTADYFQGVIDDLEMFVLGTATVSPFQNYGTFAVEEDNAFIANELSGTAAGDLTGDGAVMGDGSGGANDDVAIFVANWEAENLVNNIRVGDLNSRAQGDFNFDGIVDLDDWHILRTSHVNAASLDLGALLAARVPEPTALALTAMAVIALAGRQRRIA